MWDPSHHLWLHFREALGSAARPGGAWGLHLDVVDVDTVTQEARVSRVMLTLT